MVKVTNLFPNLKRICNPPANTSTENAAAKLLHGKKRKEQWYQKFRVDSWDFPKSDFQISMKLKEKIYST